ncbi:uncharacterized protein LOC124126338 isoform X2 [Haliotis rufescens]|uniref:uncharacterized protein LOC124126338 isoform X2 n=1 Tax=Haliotis rufescens TaxID=6454 RepID=UPI00201F7EC5|nr:uncharacterized protein LOC124126338 isoform X2 [Haliotis rufescens]
MPKVTVLLLVLCGVRWMEADNVCTEYCKESIMFFPCTGCLLPINPYGFFGRNATLNCTLLDANSSSSDLYFTWKSDELLPAEYQTVISPSTMQLNMPVLDNDKFVGALMIQCLKNDSKTEITNIGIQLLTVDYPPHVSNLSAVCFNWKSLEFTWEEQYKHENHVNVSAIWTSRGANSWFYCNGSRSTSCVIDSIHSSEYSINITVTNTVVGETFRKSLTVRPDELVKPAAVTSLRVSHWTSCCVTLAWTHGQLGMKTMIFRAVAVKDGSELHSTVTGNTTTLCDLKPDTHYTFLVSVKPTVGGFWSNTQSINQTTHEDVPSFGANLTGGNYLSRRCSSNNLRSIYIYLKPPDKQHQNGRLTFFTASAVPSDGSSSITKPNLPISSTTVQFEGLKCNVDYNVDVSVSTAIGPSVPTKLHIPREGVVEPPTSVRVPYNSTSVRVEWKSDVQPRHWTVLWCQGSKDLCSGDLDWLIVDGTQRSVAVPYARFQEDGNMFAVSMTTDEGVSSQLMWSYCVYEEAKIPEKKPSIQAVNPQPDLGLTVTWASDECPEQTLITHYIIEYCYNNYTACRNSTVPSDQEKLVIANLKEGTNYSVRLKPLAQAGAGPYSNPVYAVPLYSNLSAGEITGIAFACAFFVVVFSFSMVKCYRYASKKCREKEKIILPSVPDFISADLTEQIRTVAFKPLPEEKCAERQKQTNLHTYRQLSVDSGRGSLTGDDQSPSPLSPSSQFQPKFEPVDEEEEAKRGSGSEPQSAISLPQDYSKVADTSGSAGEPPPLIMDCLPVVCLTDPIIDNPWDDSYGSLDEESFNNQGYDEYVIAANREGEVEKGKGVNPGFVPDEEADKSEADELCQEDMFVENARQGDCLQGVSNWRRPLADNVIHEGGHGMAAFSLDNFYEGLKVPTLENQYQSLPRGNKSCEDVTALKTQPEVPYTSQQGENHSYEDVNTLKTQPENPYTSLQESRNPQIPSDITEKKISIPEGKACKDERNILGEGDEGLGSSNGSYTSDTSDHQDQLTCL